MPFHLAMYSASLAQVSDTDVTAATDDVLTRRNTHLIFDRPVNLIGAWGSGTTLTRARFGNPQFNQVGRSHLWPLERSATVPDLPEIIDFRDDPIPMPRNEELTLLATTDAVGPARVEFPLWLAPPEFVRNVPAVRSRIMTRATVVIAAGAEGAWGLAAEPVFESDLLGGVYTVLGAYLVAANAIAFRILFPNAPTYGGRQFRPGGLVTNAIGDAPKHTWHREMGEWGRFHSYTPPTVQVFGDAAGGTYEMRLWLGYLGEGESLLDMSNYGN